jgi:uncharacterized membrane protein YeaQ/YmgE (transglycosylase-associated protein family)
MGLGTKRPANWSQTGNAIYWSIKARVPSLSSPARRHANCSKPYLRLSRGEPVLLEGEAVVRALDGIPALLIGLTLGVLAFVFPGPQYSVVDHPLLGLLGPAIGVAIGYAFRLIKAPRLSAKIIIAALLGALVLKLGVAMLFDPSDEGMAAATAGFLRDGLWYGISFAFVARGLATLPPEYREKGPS